MKECVNAWKQRTKFEDFRARSAYKKVTGAGVQILNELEGPRGGGAWFAGHGRIVPTYNDNYSILVPYVNDYL